MNYEEKKISAVIVAAGMGKRMKSKINKQYLLLEEKPILSHTIDVFEQNKYIDEIIIVTREEEIDYCKVNAIDKYNFNKVKKVVSGGTERQDSVYEGLKIWKCIYRYSWTTTECC